GRPRGGGPQPPGDLARRPRPPRPPPRRGPECVLPRGARLRARALHRPPSRDPRRRGDRAGPPRPRGGIRLERPGTAPRDMNEWPATTTAERKPHLRRRNFAVGLAAILLAAESRGEAQPPGKIPRIGILAAPSSALLAARIEGFRQGLRELGYVERRNILIEYRMADGRLDRLAGLAAELVRF